MEEPEQGFIRGENEPCVFLHPDRDIVVCLYVDDCLIDGDEDDIKWFLEKINKRFKCKDEEWLSAESPLDYLGMEVTMDTDHIYYTNSMCAWSSRRSQCHLRVPTLQCSTGARVSK